MVSLLDCESKGTGFKSMPGKRFVISVPCTSKLGYKMSTGSVGRSDGEAEDWYDEAKKVKVLLLHIINWLALKIRFSVS